MLTAAPTAASRAAPSRPSGHGRFCAETAVVVWATAAIHAAGTHARAVSPSRSQGKGAMHASAPAMVAGAAAGSATRLAAIPSSGTCGSISTISGPQTSWADVGTVSPRARARGIHRSNPTARGRASTRRAAVAPADKAKPSERASHGSMTSNAVTAAESTAMPTAGRPRARASIATTAIAAARTTLGSGVTRATKATSTTVAPTTRTPREAPHSASNANAAPTTIAQFAPETAVRCDSEAAFMAASVDGSRLEVSPTARPGTRPAPGCGSPRVEATSPSRSPSRNAHSPSGGRTSCTSLARTTSIARSAGSAATPRPTTPTPPPMPVPASAARPSASTITRTGTPPLSETGPARTSAAIASNHAPPSGVPSMRPATVRSSSSCRPPWVCRAATWARTGATDATAPAAAPAQARATATTPTTARRRHTKTPVATSAHEASARAGTAASGTPTATPAAAQVRAATVTERSARCRIARRTLIRAPDRGCRRASSARFPAPTGGRRRW